MRELHQTVSCRSVKQLIEQLVKCELASVSFTHAILLKKASLGIGAVFS